MADDEQQDQESKTEEPSQKRRDEYADEGQNALAPELTGAMSLIGAFVAIGMGAAVMRDSLVVFSTGVWMKAGSPENPAALIEEVLPELGIQIFRMVGPILLGALIGGIAGSVLQGAGELRWKILEPKPMNLNVFKAVIKMFSKKNIGDMVMNVIKLTIVWIASSFAAWRAILMLTEGSAAAEQAVAKVCEGIESVALRGLLVLLVLGLLEHARKRFQLEKQMMMTKQESKQEHKAEDGDPQIRARRREIARSYAHKTPPALATQNATVVITNPVHYAVALRYKQGETSAPKVVAKGAGVIAELIKRTAKEHDIPIVENAPLARALFRSVPLDREIPPGLYEGVARVLAKIYELARKRGRNYLHRN